MAELPSRPVLVTTVLPLVPVRVCLMLWVRDYPWWVRPNAACVVEKCPYSVLVRGPLTRMDACRRRRYRLNREWNPLVAEC